MISEEDIKAIQNIAEDLLLRLEIEKEQIHIEVQEEDNISIDVSIAEPQLLIGEKGQTLFELQHILKALLRKKFEKPLRLLLDVNDYRKNKESYLKDLANDAADEVVLLKKEKELPPMPAADRRIIHLTIAQRQDVVSESAGEGLERKVVIRLKPF